MEPQGLDKLAPKPSSLSSAPTTPSPVLAASSLSRSTSASHTDSSPSYGNDGTAEPGPKSPSSQVKSLPSAVAHAVRCIRRQYLVVDTLGQSPALLASRSFDTPSQEHTQADHQGSQKEDNHSIRPPSEDSAGDSLWLEIRLTNQEWLILQEHIRSLEKEDPELWYYIDEKLRYDYFAALDLLALRFRRTRMPSRIHESLIRTIDRHINHEFARVAVREKERDKNSSVARFAEDVQPWGSLRMTFCHIPSKTPSEDESDAEQGPGATSQHEPDCSYSVTKNDENYPNLYPAAVIEVVTSKKRGRLAMLADDYLLGTYVGPMVQVMLAIDIDIERLESGSTPRGLARVMEYRRKETPSAEDDDSLIYTVQEIEHVCNRRLPGLLPLANDVISRYSAARTAHVSQAKFDFPSRILRHSEMTLALQTMRRIRTSL
ncbi:hypothetical protein diail_6283 [Diaporthe ilicicola]|nr:hypothetical protein diail_6283 [Diaporthe ilicicola]